MNVAWRWYACANRWNTTGRNTAPMPGRSTNSICWWRSSTTAARRAPESVWWKPIPCRATNIYSVSALSAQMPSPRFSPVSCPSLHRAEISPQPRLRLTLRLSARYTWAICAIPQPARAASRMCIRSWDETTGARATCWCAAISIWPMLTRCSAP